MYMMLEVVGNDGVGADVREDGQGHADDGARARGQAVDAVGEVGAVADRRDDEDDEWDEDHPHVLSVSTIHDKSHA